MLLGIVGDSGSGKSTLIRGIAALFGLENVTEICLDDYHLYDRVTRARLGLTALNPAANNLSLMCTHLRGLQAGLPIFKPIYDHSIGTFAPAEWVMPRSIVIVHGLFTLFTPELASLFDLSIYLTPEEELRLNWKVQRDTQKRGYDLEEVLRQIEERRPDAAAFIEPQQARADLVVSFHRPYPGASFEPLAAQLFRRAGAHTSQLQEWANTSLDYQQLTDGEMLIIPATLEASRIHSLERQWQSKAGLVMSQENKLGQYQTPEGEWRQSCSLILTQSLIAGCLLQQHDPALMVA